MKNMKPKILLFALCLLVVSCGEKRKDGNLLGTWETFDSSERNSWSKALAATGSELATKLIKERITFEEDGDFTSRIISPLGRYDNKFYGDWERSGDTIYLSYYSRDDFSYTYYDTLVIIELSDDVLQWKELHYDIEETGGKCMTPKYTREW